MAKSNVFVIQYIYMYNRCCLLVWTHSDSNCISVITWRRLEKASLKNWSKIKARNIANRTQRRPRSRQRAKNHQSQCSTLCASMCSMIHHLIMCGVQQLPFALWWVLHYVYVYCTPTYTWKVTLVLSSTTRTMRAHSWCNYETNWRCFYVGVKAEVKAARRWWSLRTSRPRRPCVAVRRCRSRRKLFVKRPPPSKTYRSMSTLLGSNMERWFCLKHCTCNVHLKIKLLWFLYFFCRRLNCDSVQFIFRFQIR